MLFAQIMAATLLVGLVSLVGAVLLMKKTDLQRITVYFVSIASGSLLGTAFMHLIPESLELRGASCLPMICAGVFLFFILEKFLIWRHCHAHQHPEDFSRPIAARMVVFGDAAHNFLDGVIIATSFAVSPAIGISTTAAIILHEIPQELGDFALLVHGGFPVKRALWLNLATGMFAILGAVLTYFFLDLAPAATGVLLPVTAGGFLYIALADLIPQLHEPATGRQTAVQILLLAAGFGSIAVFAHH